MTGIIAKAQFELYAFICILMEGEADASDVLQDTNLALWTHAERYDPKLPFLPWARSFAYNHVRAFRLKQSRSRLVFDEALLDWFAEHAAPQSEGSVPVLEVLSRGGCAVWADDGRDPVQLARTLCLVTSQHQQTPLRARPISPCRLEYTQARMAQRLEEVLLSAIGG